MKYVFLSYLFVVTPFFNWFFHMHNMCRCNMALLLLLPRWLSEENRQMANPPITSSQAQHTSSLLNM